MFNLILDLFLVLLGAIIGGVFGFWFGIHQARPNLRVSGSGGGQGYAGIPTTSLTISNVPRLMGFEIGETQIMGRYLHNSRRIGELANVNPAEDCTARLISKTGRDTIANLYWSNPEGSPTSRVTIASGKSASLLVFARVKEDYPTYFVYQPESQGATKAKIPVDQFKFDKNEDFIVEVKYNFGRLREEVGVRLTLSTDHHLYFQYSYGSSAF